MGDDACDCTPERVNVFTLNLDDLQTMTLERLLQLVALEVFRRVASNGDIIVI